MDAMEDSLDIVTRILPIDVDKVGTFLFEEPEKCFLGNWTIDFHPASQDTANIKEAVHHLRTSDLPVAIPTETVYGLGADATRSNTVLGIYRAKQRPADNPLIVHVSSLTQIRRLLSPALTSPSKFTSNVDQDLIPSIYHSLISRFWPGPLTILLPLPTPSPLAPEVTGNLSTFGVRMPSSRLALALIHLADVPIAAPSANVSTKPSPTTAAHVLHDLAGRINLIVDGGPCMVGVESTVVDGLVSPPVVLRPGGISIEMLRHCCGWENVAKGYQDGSESSPPRAPGMKYKHYSPKARVVLVHGPLNTDLISKYARNQKHVGLAKTKTWKDEDLANSGKRTVHLQQGQDGPHKLTVSTIELKTSTSERRDGNDSQKARILQSPGTSGVERPSDGIEVVSIDLGIVATSVARNLFWSLRELDLQGVNVIFVEAIDESEGDEAAAIMNRLRKAAEMEVQV
ncbi:MAG: hypothetical protein Q9174_000923 [Haloplaca sp. 1 TL-2023]